MLWAKADRASRRSLPAAFGALIAILWWVEPSVAQEPPLSIPPAGALPPLASGGCDAGLANNADLYGSTSLYKTTNTSNGTTGLNAPLNSSPSAGINIPLFSNSLAGDNVPLYSAPDAGINTPLYSNSSAFRVENLSGGYSGVRQVASVSNDGNPIACRSGIPLGEWLLYPSIRLYSLYSDNLFLAPSQPINTTGLGATPTISAQWTNGIHTTNLYASLNTEAYPNNSSLNNVDRQATFTQTYSPLPDLSFSVLGDYSHTTITGSLTNSIPSPVTAPVSTPTRLPDGNYQLPNGEIASPSGQVIGNINSGSGANGVSVVNPYDQYTTTASMTKIFNDAILSVSGSLAQTNYQNEQNPNSSSSFSSFTSKTFTDSGSIALGPLFYAYTNGTFSSRLNDSGIDPASQAYRFIGGLGTRQFGLFRTSVYGGYQGSNSDTSGTAGGDVYGASFSYYPSLVWTIIAAIDETINKAPGNGTSNLALFVNSPVQIALSSSTNITHSSLQSQYQLTRQWTATGSVSYTHIAYYGSSRLDGAWQFDAQLNYEIWRNMTLAWEYEYTDVSSNAPGVSAARNYLTMSANYRF